MRLRCWLSRADAIVTKLLVHLGSAAWFAISLPPGLYGPDPDADSGSDRAPWEAPPPRATHDPHQDGDRNHGPPAGHPERRCTTPPSEVERELWASLGIDPERR
ncbi:DUF6059 family protein [Streptomyces sp. NPDC052051]|uniref:DUF6059 family protein n=1 Tax=Streptomyces sp. NPDC052051 TaxID=3154649 RepID=UPI00341B876A